MADAGQFDDIDYQILDLLRADARRTLRDIATRVNLTVAPVKRRIERMEASGIIEAYTIRVNEALATRRIEAVTELRVAGNLELAGIVEIARRIPEVTEVLTIAGDPDALVRIRVDSVDHLQSVVNRLRTAGEFVTGTRTLVVLGSWYRSQDLPATPPDVPSTLGSHPVRRTVPTESGLRKHEA